MARKAGVPGSGEQGDSRKWVFPRASRPGLSPARTLTQPRDFLGRELGLASQTSDPQSRALLSGGYFQLHSSALVICLTAIHPLVLRRWQGPSRAPSSAEPPETALGWACSLRAPPGRAPLRQPPGNQTRGSLTRSVRRPGNP